MKNAEQNALWVLKINLHLHTIFALRLIYRVHVVLFSRKEIKFYIRINYILCCRVIACLFAGMHKKSIEAQSTFKGDGSNIDQEPVDKADDRKNSYRVQTDIRSESIATLRAKALEHCAKISQSDVNNDNLDKREDQANNGDEDSKSEHSKYKSLFEESRCDSDIVTVV